MSTHTVAVRLARAALVTLTALVTLGALTAVPLDAQPATGAEAPPRYQISVLTFGPGDAVFERFGHNALRVRDFLTGADLAYNWGMFSFDEPRFLSRFLSGDTRYWVEAFPTSWLLEVYAAQDRESIEQVLALTPREAATLAEAVAANATPEQRFYRYDYFRRDFIGSYGFRVVCGAGRTL